MLQSILTSSLSSGFRLTIFNGMAKKQRRLSASSSASSASLSSTPGRRQPAPSHDPPLLASLPPKPCITCGRVITPRAKWARNWAEIKTCSDRCKATKPGKVIATWTQQGAEDATKGQTKDKHLKEPLQELVQRAQKDGDKQVLRLDIETWVEATILQEAYSQRAARQRQAKSTSSETRELKKGAARPDSTLEDVESSLLQQVLSVLGPTCNGLGGEDPASQPEESARGKELQHPLWTALDSPPGVRERVRRAARRLALGLSRETTTAQREASTSADVDASRAPQIELLQNGRVLRSLEDYSFAKGRLVVRARQQ